MIRVGEEAGGKGAGMEKSWKLRLKRCFYSVRAGFPGLRGMNSFHTSLLISSQLQSLCSY